MNDTDINAQLARILSDPLMGPNRFPARFLRYIVEESIANRASALKAYSIAMDVLGRPDTFNPQKDSSVRVLAGRVRKLLGEYYDGAGRDDPIIISIPTGSYIPRFDKPSPSTGVRPEMSESDLRDHLSRNGAPNCYLPTIPQKRNLHLPVLAIAGCVNKSEDHKYDHYCAALEEELAHVMSKWEAMRIICRGDALFSKIISPRDLFEKADLILFCSMTAGKGNAVRLHIKLLNSQSHACMWSHVYDFDQAKTEYDNNVAEVACAISDMVAQPFGIITNPLISNSNTTDIDALTPYECVLQTLAYYGNASEKSFARAFEAAQLTVETCPEFALGWSTLADLYCEDYRIAYSGLAESATALDSALYCAREAISHNPQSSYGHLALSNINFAKGRIEEGIKYGDRAMELHPGNSGLAAKYGHHRAYGGDWAGGCEILEEAMPRQLAVKDYQTYVLAEDAYRREEFDAALNHIHQVKPTEIYFQPMFKSAIYASQGLMPEARDSMKLLMQREPGFNGRLLKETLSRDVEMDYVEQVVDGARHAGLPH